jgi:hypothetical protein
LDFRSLFVQLLFSHFPLVRFEKEENGGKANYQYQDHHRGDEDRFGGRGTGHKLKDKGLGIKDKVERAIDK